MSPDSTDDLLPLLVMMEAVGKIEIYSARFDSAIDFFQDSDQAMFNASLLLLMNIGEQGNKVSEDIKTRHPHLPFAIIRGLRNRTAHDYVGIDYEMIYDIIKSDIPVIKSSLVSLIGTELSRGTFDLGEFQAAQKSPFYRHVDFDTLV